jgi:hypothetical protein
LEAALRADEVVLLSLSPAYMDSANPPDEGASAIDHGKQIVPALGTRCDASPRLRRLEHIALTFTAANDPRVGEELLRRLALALDDRDGPPLKRLVMSPPKSCSFAHVVERATRTRSRRRGFERLLLRSPWARGPL